MILNIKVDLKNNTLEEDASLSDLKISLSNCKTYGYCFVSFNIVYLKINLLTTDFDNLYYSMGDKSCIKNYIKSQIRDQKLKNLLKND